MKKKNPVVKHSTETELNIQLILLLFKMQDQVASSLLWSLNNY